MENFDGTIEKYLHWDKPQIWVKERCFDIVFTKEEIEITCDWDYGYGGSGTETFTIPTKVMEQLIKEINGDIK